MARTVTSRQITPAEAAVIQAALEQTPSRSPVTSLVVPIKELRVVGQCECGCDSVDFIPSETELHSRPVADGTGTTPSGGTVGIIVWGTDNAITSLEIYDLGAGDGNVRLPVPESIQSWDSGAA
jgi:hypothetical protein